MSDEKYLKKENKRLKADVAYYSDGYNKQVEVNAQLVQELGRLKSFEHRYEMLSAIMCALLTEQYGETEVIINAKHVRAVYQVKRNVHYEESDGVVRLRATLGEEEKGAEVLSCT